jgi:hypothetical protein
MFDAPKVKPDPPPVPHFCAGFFEILKIALQQQ